MYLYSSPLEYLEFYFTTVCLHEKQKTGFSPIGFFDDSEAYISFCSAISFILELLGNNFIEALWLLVLYE